MKNQKRSQLFRHATTWSNYVTIAVDGIQKPGNGHDGRKNAIWLHKPAKTAWAILHTMQRHGVDLSDIVVLEVSLDRRLLKHAGRGLWYVEEEIPASAIRGVYPGNHFTKSRVASD
jgi:hypothetical protein